MTWRISCIKQCVQNQIAPRFADTSGQIFTSFRTRPAHWLRPIRGRKEAAEALKPARTPAHHVDIFQAAFSGPFAANASKAAGQQSAIEKLTLPVEDRVRNGSDVCIDPFQNPEHIEVHGACFKTFRPPVFQAHQMPGG